MEIRFLRKLARYQAINWPLFWWCRIQRFLRTSFRRRPLRFPFSRRHSIPFHVCSSPSPPSPPSPKPKYFSPTLESIPITNIRFARYHLSLPSRWTTRVAWKNGDLASRIPEQAGFVCRPPSPTTARPRTRPLSAGKIPSRVIPLNSRKYF